MEPYIKCNDGIKCISTEKLCDMRSDCYDESDENPEMCKGMLTKYVKVNLKRRNKMKKNNTTLRAVLIAVLAPGAKQCSGTHTYTSTHIKTNL